jgi:hypothetical protein
MVHVASFWKFLHATSLAGAFAVKDRRCGNCTRRPGGDAPEMDGRGSRIQRR